MYRIALRVVGVDLQDHRVLSPLGDLLSDVAWTSIDDRVIAEFYTEAIDPVGHAVQVARQIECNLPGVTALEVDPDLVGISDIALRVGVTREAVRNWVDGRRGPGSFPPPVGSVGGGDRSIRIWSWLNVNAWLKQFNLNDEDELLTPQQVAELNAALRKVVGRMGSSWKTATVHADFDVPVRTSHCSGAARATPADEREEFGQFFVQALQRQFSSRERSPSIESDLR